MQKHRDEFLAQPSSKRTLRYRCPEKKSDGRESGNFYWHFMRHANIQNQGRLCIFLDHFLLGRGQGAESETCKYSNGGVQTAKQSVFLALLVVRARVVFEGNVWSGRGKVK